MNIENIRKIIDWIKKDGGKHLLMSTFIDNLDENGKGLNNGGEELKFLDCKTAFCIAGTANLLRVESIDPSWNGFQLDRHFSDVDKAAEWMGISDDQASDLFYMNGIISRNSFDQLSPAIRARAAKIVLETLIETGKIRWDEAINTAKL